MGPEQMGSVERIWEFRGYGLGEGLGFGGLGFRA